jgi:Raf kinase inhibitor-like YbhB/YbcL family protein
MMLKSIAFASGEPIPVGHTADGADLSPPLAWSGVPAEAVELALVCDDPDAPRADPWVHWVLYGLSPQLVGLSEGISRAEQPDAPPCRQGKNDFRRIGYGGPAPPRGHGTHHYHFVLFALDRAVGLAPGANKQQLLDAMSGHILDRAELVGTYRR